MIEEKKKMLAVIGEISKRGWWRECPAQPAQQELTQLQHNYYKINRNNKKKYGLIRNYLNPDVWRGIYAIEMEKY